MKQRTRLDRFISTRTGVNRRDVRLMLARGRVGVDGVVASDIQQQVHEFSHVTIDGAVLQANNPVYLMLNKPAGVVSATRDEQHSTVIDLLDHPQQGSLHIVGRLDFNTTGLMLLTNDGRWSRALTQPESKVAKCYRVTLANPITDDYISAFAEGMYFPFEGITTRPATLRILSDYVAEVILKEGRYHQIKRMFGRFRNPVVALHRSSIGALALDSALMPGQYRPLTPAEVAMTGSVELATEAATEFVAEACQ